MELHSNDWLLARAWYASGRAVGWTCEKCGSNFKTMADDCPVPLEDPCPGFIKVEELYAEFEKTWRDHLNQRT